MTTGLIGSGYGKLIQNGSDATALSSAFVVLLGDMAYYNMGGTGPAGIRIGASHPNMYEAINGPGIAARRPSIWASRIRRVW